MRTDGRGESISISISDLVTARYAYGAVLLTSYGRTDGFPRKEKRQETRELSRDELELELELEPEPEQVLQIRKSKLSAANGVIIRNKEFI